MNLSKSNKHILCVICVLIMFNVVSCGDGGDVSNVKNFKVGSTNLGKMLEGVDAFENTEWDQVKDKQGRKLVVFKADIKPEFFIEQFRPGNGWGEHKDKVKKNGKKLIEDGTFYYTATFEFDPQTKAPDVKESKVVSMLDDKKFSQDINLDSASQGKLYSGILERNIKDMAFDMIKF